GRRHGGACASPNPTTGFAAWPPASAAVSSSSRSASPSRHSPNRQRASITMSITNPFLETKSLVPAILGAALAAFLVLIVGLAVLFSAEAPYVVAAHGSVPLNLQMIGQVALEFFRGDTCSPGLTKIIGLDCRFQYLDRVAQAIAESKPALIHVAAVLAAIVVSGATTACMMYATTSKRERFITLRGWRLLFDRDGRASLRAAITRTGRLLKRGLWLLPHVQLTSECEGYNILALGTQGSAKTST